MPGRRCHVMFLSQEGAAAASGSREAERRGGRRSVEGVVSGQRESRRADQSEGYALNSCWHPSDPRMSPGCGRLQGTRVVSGKLEAELVSSSMLLPPNHPPGPAGPPCKPECPSLCHMAGDILTSQMATGPLQASLSSIPICWLLRPQPPWVL